MGDSSSLFKARLEKMGLDNPKIGNISQTTADCSKGGKIENYPKPGLRVWCGDDQLLEGEGADICRLASFKDRFDDDFNCLDTISTAKYTKDQTVNPVNILQNALNNPLFEVQRSNFKNTTFSIDVIRLQKEKSDQGQMWSIKNAKNFVEIVNELLQKNPKQPDQILTSLTGSAAQPANKKFGNDNFNSQREFWKIKQTSSR